MKSRADNKILLVYAMLMVLVALLAVQAAHASPAAAPERGFATEPTAESQPGVVERLGKVALFGGGQLALQYTALRIVAPANWHDFGNVPEPSAQKFVSNFSRAPVWEPDKFGGGGLIGLTQADGDPWVINVLGHGVQGTELVLRMRREGFDWWQAALGGVVQSTVWEYGFEGVHETPSLWDLVYTPVAGAVLGEGRYRLVRLADKLNWYALRCAVDPVGEIDAWLGRKLYGREG